MVSYTHVVSPLISGSLLTLTEGISAADMNRDGRVDLVIPSVGNSQLPISPTDPPITVLLADASGAFHLADTSDLAPGGWINDVVFLDSDLDGYPEILSIDHGREIAYRSEYWSPLRIAEWNEATASFVELTSLPAGNLIPQFHHNASSVGDLNRDGILDVVVANLGGPQNFQFLLGDSSAVFVDATSTLPTELRQFSSAYMSVGAAGIFDAGDDGDLDVILLPYSDRSPLQHQREAEILNFENGSFASYISIPAKDSASVTVPGAAGYPYVQFADVDGNGYTDVVGIVESPSLGTNVAIFTVMLQQPDGSYRLEDALPAEPLHVSLEGSVTFNGQVFTGSEQKFWLNDLDGDGDLDLFWGKMYNAFRSDFPSSIFFNDGTGHFYRDYAKVAELFADVQWSASARTFVSDLNEDGIGDFVVIEALFNQEPATSVNAFGTQQRVNVFYSTSGRADVQSGSARSESLVGGTGASTLSGGGGNDLVDGGAGIDTAVYAASASRYAVTRVGGDLVVTDSSGTEGVDRLTQVERLRFADKLLAFDVIGGDAGVVAQLIGAVFGRDALRPDYVGIGLSLLEAGMSRDALAEMALDARLGASASSRDVVSVLYQNVVGTSVPADALVTYAGLIDSGAYTAGGLAIFAATTWLNNANIDLVGLHARGVEFTLA